MTTAKKIFALIACLALVLTSAGVCFADTDPVYEIPVGTFADASSSSFNSTGVKILTRESDSSLGVGVAAQQVGTFIFFYDNPDIPSVICWAMIIGSSTDSIENLRYTGSWAIAYYNPGHNTFITDSTTGLMYYKANINKSGVILNPSIPHYSTLAEGLAAAESYLSVVAGSDAMEIPAGYALKLSSESPFDIGQIQLSYSNTWNFPSSSGSSSRTNGARLGLMDDSNISNGLSADTGILINWTPTNANLFGRASNYSYSSNSTHSTSDGFSYVITNPLYGGQYVQSDGSDLHQNVSMYAFFNYSYLDDVTFTLIPLKAVLSYDQGVFTYSNVFDMSDGVYPGTITPGQGTDPGSVDFGDTPQGGGNSDEPPLSENTTIFGLLNTLTNYFTGFFNSAINAIQSLFTTGSTFMQSVVTMFSWLPVELTTIIFSAFVILLVVGVLKLLWR